MSSTKQNEDRSEQAQDETTSASNSQDAGSPVEPGTKGIGHEEAAKPPSRLKKLWAKTGLSPGILLLMVKAAIPQTIGIAIYQSKGVAETYTTVGYLVGIIAVLGFCFMPRAKFVQTMAINLVATCVGASIALLAIWTAIQARIHTTPPGTVPGLYNSSASAVLAIWLFFQVYVANALRSARPQLQLPAVMYTIFTNVSMTFAASEPDMSSAITLVERLLKAFMTGFGLATAVSLLLPPITQRSLVFKEMTGYIQSLRRLVKAQANYAASLENIDLSAYQTEKDLDRSKTPKPSDTKEEAALKASVHGARSIHSKLMTDLAFAKREVAYGKMDAKDLSEIFTLFRNIFLPLISMPTLMDIFKRVAQLHGWYQPGSDLDPKEQRVVEDWQDIMKMLHAPFAEVGGSMDKAFEHVLLRLQLTKPSKKSKTNIDEEAKPGSNPHPGSDEFCAWYEREVEVFYNRRKVTLRQWCEEKKVSLPSNLSNKNDAHWAEQCHLDKFEGSTRDQRQLYVVLYIEYLLHTAGKQTIELVKYADMKATDGTLSRSRLIGPGFRRLKKWLKSVFAVDEDVNENSYTQSMDGVQNIYLGEAFKARKDAEHLPPQNAFEKIGDAIRLIPSALRSSHSVFGFRVACATLSIAIIAYLEASAVFFIEQRLVWAMIMVAISMSRTAGQSTFNFVLRIFGTVCSMIASYLVYYIPDGHTAGILVFLFIWEIMCFYIVFTRPRYVVVGIISAVTVILIIGYELQVRVLGVELATSNGQPAYNINILAPYRLATVAGGLFVAWIWTIFPYPVTEHSALRQELGASLYMAANFYAIVREMIACRVRNDGGDPSEKTSPFHRLYKAAEKVFGKGLTLIESLRMHSGFIKYEVALGGRFPREKYDRLIGLTDKILSYSALMSFASRSFNTEGESGDQWQTDFRALLAKLSPTSHEITSRLCLLSSAITSGRPLPPYLQDLQPFKLTQQLHEIDTDILSVRHISEPGYAAFAVLQICGHSILSDLNSLTAEVRDLVGELDFSFHYTSTAATSHTSFVDSSSSDFKGKAD